MPSTCPVMSWIARLPIAERSSRCAAAAARRPSRLIQQRGRSDRGDRIQATMVYEKVTWSVNLLCEPEPRSREPERRSTWDSPRIRSAIWIQLRRGATNRPTASRPCSKVLDQDPRAISRSGNSEQRAHSCMRWLFRATLGSPTDRGAPSPGRVRCCHHTAFRSLL